MYKLVLGDFNLPNIKWTNYTTNTGCLGFSHLFIKKI